MKLQSWRAPGGSDELAVSFEPEGGQRLLVLPAWFDESNKLRHFTIETMRALQHAGIASVLPDFPGCNESTAPLNGQDLDIWRAAAHAAASQLGCTHVLAMRAGANIAPAMPGFAYAPLAGKSALRALLRARVISSKEAGTAETREDLLELGKTDGLELAGYNLGPAMVNQLAAAELPSQNDLSTIAQGDIGGGGLWLRMEPDHDQGQAEALAARIIAGMRA